MVDAASPAERKPSLGLSPPEQPKQGPRSPNSMPVPAIPRRAAPPRRKTPAPAPPPEADIPLPPSTTDLPESKSPISGTPTQEEKEKEYIAPDEVAPAAQNPTDVADHEVRAEEVHSEVATPPPASPTELAETDLEEEGDSKDALNVDTDVSHDQELDAKTPIPAGVEEEEEEEEEARKKRIAAKISQMGGVNPFAAGGFKLPSRTPTRETTEGEPAVTTTKDHDKSDAIPKVAEPESIISHPVHEGAAVKEEEKEDAEEEDDHTKKTRLHAHIGLLGALGGFRTPSPSFSSSAPRDEEQQRAAEQHQILEALTTPGKEQEDTSGSGKAHVYFFTPPRTRQSTVDSLFEGEVPPEGSVPDFGAATEEEEDDVGALTEGKKGGRKATTGDVNTGKEDGEDASSLAAAAAVAASSSLPRV